MTGIIGQGWKFPVRVNGRGGLSWSAGDDSLREAIWLILATPLRSRIMQPDFGCGVHDYLFAPNSANTRAQIEGEVKRALIRWEPRVDVLRVRAATASEDAGALLIEIETRVRTNNAALNLVYPFYLSEGIAR
ncbi:MAG: GPW/gp25 family protein [Rhodobacterales bacterium]|nr:GPW/gp25 family protein [Rhodobacterales bacterium]